MAFTSHWHLQQTVVDVRKSERFYPNNFSFANSKAPLTGLDFGTVGTISSARKLNHVRRELRKAGVSPTIAFAAVAMKTLVAAIDEHASCENPGALVFMMPVDPRPLGEWDDERDKGPCQFPVVANLSFLTFARVAFQDLKDGSLEEIASLLKRKVYRIYSDPEFLLQEIQATSKQDSLSYFCGCSSFQIPNRAACLGLAPSHFETMRIGENARCWLTAITFGGKTEIDADVVLPVQGLTTDAVRKTIGQVVQGTTVEPLSNKIYG